MKENFICHDLNINNIVISLDVAMLTVYIVQKWKFT